MLKYYQILCVFPCMLYAHIILIQVILVVKHPMLMTSRDFPMFPNENTACPHWHHSHLQEYKSGCSSVHPCSSVWSCPVDGHPVDLLPCHTMSLPPKLVMVSLWVDTPARITNQHQRTINNGLSSWNMEASFRLSTSSAYQYPSGWYIIDNISYSPLVNLDSWIAAKPACFNMCL